MKRLLFTMLCPLTLLAQWSDNFSTDLSNWTGDTAFFEIDTINQLHLNAPAVANTTYLWRQSTSVFNGEWAFYVQMDFNPSSSNYALVHLVDEEEQNGYFVKLGGSEDAISLYKKSNGSNSKIIEGEIDLLDTDSVKVQVIVLRDSIGNWELWADTGYTNNYQFQGAVLDNTHTTSTHFGIQCTYTQTRSDKFFFDNISVSGTAFQDTFALPEYRNIIINELMIDPTPPNDLPEEEYIELYNKGTQTYNLQHLQIGDYSQSYPLPFYLLKPNTYILLAEDSITEGSIIITDIPSLNNSADSIRLWLNDTILIDDVNYHENWHTEEVEGGVSLELVNPFLKCSNENNWASSMSISGGTPAGENSVFSMQMDTEAPQVLGSSYHQDTLTLILDEAAHISAVSQGTLQEKNPSEWLLTFKPPLIQNQEHQIVLQEVSDCEGNTQSINLSFIVPATAEKGDLVLNEVLFNPVDGGQDFVEIYNNSDKYLDLQNWLLANHYSDTIANLKNLSDSTFIIHPQEIWVLCKDVENLLLYHPYSIKKQVIELHAMPAYNNEDGCVYLLNQTTLMDAFCYHEEMHFDLLQSVDGISLERVHPELDYWQSAAESVGFTTPTLPNSQSQTLIENSNPISIEPTLFSPNNDGQDDLLQIKISLGPGQYAGSIHIYDQNGLLIKLLQNNVLFGSEEVFFWDGTSDQGYKAPIGRYILFLEAINHQGKIVKAKKTCVLGGRL